MLLSFIYARCTQTRRTSVVGDVSGSKLFFFVQAEDGIRGVRSILEFGRVLFQTLIVLGGGGFLHHSSLKAQSLNEIGRGRVGKGCRSGWWRCH